MSYEATSGTGTQPALSRDQVAWRWRVFTSAYLAYVGYYLCRKVFTICKKPLAGHLGIGLDQIAHVWTAYLLAYMIGQFVCSFAGRKWGPRLLLLCGLGISIIIGVVFGFANSYRTFLSFMFFNGLVQASGWPGSVGAVSEWIRKRERGAIMGFLSTNYVIGNILVKSFGGYLLGAYGWRWSFWGCTIISFGIWWMIYFWQHARPQTVGLPPVVEPEVEDTRAVRASTEDGVTLSEYLRIVFNPIILVMGASFLCIKFLRYALDSWLPTFLAILGLNEAQASYYSAIFDVSGILPIILLGWALDRVFQGNWAKLSFVMAIGMIIGYLIVLRFETNAIAMAFAVGIVGLAMYGPDTVLCGAAAIQVAGERNGVAVAGIVNGLGSIGPIIQEEVIGYFMKDEVTGIHKTNLLCLGLAVLFALLMLVTMWRLQVVQRQHATSAQAP